MNEAELIQKKEQIKKTVGKNLHFARRMAGFSLEQVGDVLNTDRKRIGNIESGKGAAMRSDELYILAELYQIPIGWLFENLEEKTEEILKNEELVQLDMLKKRVYDLSKRAELKNEVKTTKKGEKKLYARMVNGERKNPGERAGIHYMGGIVSKSEKRTKIKL